MKKMKILCLDHEAAGFDQLRSLIKLYLGETATLTLTEDIDSFKKNFRIFGPWNIFIINFQKLEFLEMKLHGLRRFITEIKNSQDSPFRILALSGEPGQISQLKNLGIDAMPKSYPLKKIEEKMGLKLLTVNGISIDAIQRIVSVRLDVPHNQMQLKTRKREIVQARQITMHLAKKFTKNSLKTIGEHFGGRDHTTVIHAVQTVRHLMDSDPDFKKMVTDLEDLTQLTLQ